MSGNNYLSDYGFDYLKNSEAGRQRVSLSVDHEYGAQIKMLQSESGEALFANEGERGILSYNKDHKIFQFQNTTSNKFFDVDQTIARNAIMQTLDDAKTTPTGINVGKLVSEGTSLEYNKAAERLHNISLNFTQQTELDQAVTARKILASRARTTSPLDITNQAEFEKMLGTTARTYGDPSTAQITGHVRAGEILPRLTGIGAKVEKTTAYSQAVADYGLPYAGLDVRSRVRGVGEAQATSGIGRSIYQNLVEGGDLSPTIAALAGDNTVNNLSEYGIQYAIGQGQEKIFGVQVPKSTGTRSS